MKTILLVEDDPFLIDIYSEKFKLAGFEAETVGDGERTLEKIREKKPDLVMLDLVLPHIDGWEILRQIKKDPELSAIPVIVFSNLGQKSDIENGLALGAAKYLIKSQYTPSEVVDEIKKILK
jgi:two-component system, OmpR family, response regulator BaeR